MTRRSLPLLLVLLAGSGHAATFEFDFGVGFNDGTRVLPVGGNSGRTLGEQRRILFEAAAQVYADRLDSDVSIRVDAAFIALECTPGGGAVLGAAGPASFATNSSIQPNVFFPRALEDALTGFDNDPGQPDIITQFNSQIDDGVCLGGAQFYYGLDDNVPSNRVALYPVVLHELAHGLGFTSLVDESDGTFPFDTPSAFDLLVFDTQFNRFWTDLSNSQRAASAVNDPDVVWDGEAVAAVADEFTGTGFRQGSLRLHAPGTIEPGSSISHFTEDASPDLLMEPALGDLVFAETDVTVPLFEDIGWPLLGNRPPIAGDDALLLDEAESVQQTTGGQSNLLANDEDPDEDGLLLSTEPTTSPEFGTVTLNRSGSFRYEHDGSENFADSFGYEVCDNGDPSLCATGTVAIAIEPINDAVVAVDDDLPLVNQDAPTVTIPVTDLLGNDLPGDDDGDGIQEEQDLSISNVRRDAGGSVSYLPGSDVVRFELENGFTGTASFDYTVADEVTSGPSRSTSDTGTASFIVNALPVAQADAADVASGETVAIDVLANDADADDGLDTGSVAIENEPALGSIAIDAATGVVSYTANAGASGVDSFSYTVADTRGARTAETQVTVTIAGTPQANADSSLGLEGAAQVIEVLANDIDSDGTIDPTTVTIVTQPANGSVEVDGVTGVVTYTPGVMFAGMDSFTYTVRDNDALTSAPATVSVTVNDVPRVADDTATVEGNQTVAVAVLTNDSDAVGGLAAGTVRITTPPEAGSASIDAQGVISYTAAAEAGEVTFGYAVSDSFGVESPEATVTITVTPPPIFVDGFEGDDPER
ncbi:MAG: Ig-like domain-containing protein [Pseudomonadota bacterium]